MMRSCAVLTLSLLAALGGCASNSYTWVSAGSLTAGALPAAGTTVSSGYVNVSVGSSSAAGALAGIALLGFVVHGYQNGYWDEGGGFGPTRTIPALAEDRTIHEQDCSKPIENSSANLRCK